MGQSNGKLGEGGTSGTGGEPGGGAQVTSEKLDVVLLVDNSRSMAAQQRVFARAMTDLVNQLTPVADDIHFGVISSSIGGHGADTCNPSSGVAFDPSQNDRAHLIPAVRSGVASYDNSGFLKWDPNATASPPGESNAQALARALHDHVLAAGEVGCGFEAPLEAAYRFLVDPAPPADVVTQGENAVPEGTDNELLAQRAAFLRPDSSVLVVILSDEDDCSTVDGGGSWISMQGASQSGSQFVLPKATSACASNPNDVCCRSCNSVENDGPPAGCVATTADPGCQNPYHDEQTDPLNLRCWDQKRRFGTNFLYGIERYVEGFTQRTIHTHAGTVVQNPLFRDGRDPSQISVASIVGLPWQDIAKNPGDPQNLEFMSAAELRSNGRWPTIVGDPAGFVAPTDPFMIASPSERSGKNPLTGDSIAPATTTALNPINGHEYGNLGNDLQYACIYPLEQTRECGNDAGCVCAPVNGFTNSPLCQGTTQTHGKAYPSLRQLELMKQLGDRAAVASICPRNNTDNSRADYGYRPAVRAIMQRVSQTLR